MKLLLDTHIFLWYISADPILPHVARNFIAEPSNDVFLSVASIWESVIKYQLGKLILPADPTEFLPEQRRQHGMESLPLFEDTFKALIPLPPYHRDPSDRILIAQALQNEMTLVTCDPQITQYQVPVLPLS